MKRWLFITGAFWVLLLSPGLCSAGAVDRPCVDCPESGSFGHSENCSVDPCGEMVRQPEAPEIASAPDHGTAPVTGPFAPEPGVADSAAAPHPGPVPVRPTLPRPQSDLPLLI